MANKSFQAGKLTTVHCFAIIANVNFPLKTALIGKVTMHIEEAPQELKTNVKEFYRTMGYHSGWSDNEQAYCFLADDVVKGCVKVEKIHGIRMLRGMYLQKNLQSKGFGTLLIKHIEPVLNEAT